MKMSTLSVCKYCVYFFAINISTYYVEYTYYTPQFGFPYLSGAGRLVIKDIIMLAGGLIIASDSARKLTKNYS